MSRLGLDHGGVAAGAKVLLQAGLPPPLAPAALGVSRVARQPALGPPFVQLDLHERSSEDWAPTVVIRYPHSRGCSRDTT